MTLLLAVWFATAGGVAYGLDLCPDLEGRSRACPVGGSRRFHIGDVRGINRARENQPEEEYSGWAPTPNGVDRFREWGHIIFAPPNQADAVDGTNRARVAMVRMIGERE
jgi:hypothetical protein